MTPILSNRIFNIQNLNNISAGPQTEPQRMTNTGTVQAANTRVATEPSTRFLSTPRPCDPMTSMSNLPRFASPAISSH